MVTLSARFKRRKVWRNIGSWWMVVKGTVFMQRLFV